MGRKMNKSDILEELYDRLPNREADNIINLILDGDPDGVAKAERFLDGKAVAKNTYNLFQSIAEKPISKTVAKFMEGSLPDAVQVCKMLSSILTQIFIQCELRGLSPDAFDIQEITCLLNAVAGESGSIEEGSDLYSDIESAIRDLGWKDSPSPLAKE